MQECLKTKTINNVKNDNPKRLVYSLITRKIGLARSKAGPGQRGPQKRPTSGQND